MHYSPLDLQDKEILKALQENAKLTVQELCSRIDLTRTPTFQRVKRLEREGVIKGYSAVIDKKKAGFGLLVFCNVTLKEHALPLLQKFRLDIGEIKEVVECHHLTGHYDYLLRVVVPDMEAYNTFLLEKLASIENIGNVQSSFVVSTLVEEQPVPFL